jgi:hypothetical protein
MQPFFKHFGGKHRLSSRLPPPLPGLPVIECFAGSAGYSCRYEPEVALLYDLDETVCAAWSYLISANAADVLRLPLLGVGQQVKEVFDDPGAAALIYKRLGQHGQPSIQGSWGMSHLLEQSSRGWSQTARARLAEQVHLVNRWQIHRESYTSAPDIEATWIFDPPYTSTLGDHYKHARSGLDIAELRDFAHSRRGIVICHDAIDGDHSWMVGKVRGITRTVPRGTKTRTSTEVYSVSMVT